MQNLINTEYIEFNKYGMITNYTKEDLALCRNKIQNDQKNKIY